VADALDIDNLGTLRLCQLQDFQQRAPEPSDRADKGGAGAVSQRTLALVWHSDTWTQRMNLPVSPRAHQPPVSPRRRGKPVQVVVAQPALQKTDLQKTNTAAEAGGR
jgi:hypothetical protein